ncbi:hypothetical protein [Tenggerimyces flavus]|uniref:Uncharacterized protein n=1 Tax=Tenggerimyces flavus TaxID=1708749 RepID=A0ABV7YCX2_9ACTN|nr:hypothetical protein [Tenggerimyces flavus]MBM7786975.1 hypothetical protein [Tenggerimyces flavus]
MPPATERGPASPQGRTASIVASLLVLAYAALLVGAAIPSAWTFLAAAVCCAALEIAWRRFAPSASSYFASLGAGGAWRALVRGVALLVFLVRTDQTRWILLAAAALLAIQLLRLAGSATADLMKRRRTMPIVSRGFDLAPVRVPKALPAVFTRHTEDLLALPDVLLLAGATAAVLTGSIRELAIGAAAAVSLALVGVCVLGVGALAMGRVPAERFTAAIQRALGKVAPNVALYFGGSPETLYQLEMWVETFEHLDVPTVILVRDRDTLRRLGPTRVPVLCVESSQELRELDLPALKLVGYVAHDASNVDLLLRRGTRHVYLGHGDSDDPAHCTPFLKAYDEVWTSGPAAAERFRAEALELTAITEIGHPRHPDADRPRPDEADEGDGLTVLYAPTWEGAGGEPSPSSVAVCGPDLVRALLDQEGVRVLYRPHPLLGTRDEATANADREIVALLDDAAVPQPAEVPDGLEAARDDLDVARAAAVTTRSERVAALEVWARKQLRPNDERTHRVVPGPPFSLTACFEAADVLLCDVSSVVSDFVASGKPYGVTNPAGLDPAAFAVRYPSSRGGYLVDADGYGLSGLLSAGRGLGDPAAEVRVAVRLELLGPEQPPAMDRLRAQVARTVEGVTLASS